MDREQISTNFANIQRVCVKAKAPYASRCQENARALAPIAIKGRTNNY